MMICNHCGQEITDGLSVCNVCGEQLQIPGIPQPVNKVPEFIPAPQQAHQPPSGSVPPLQPAPRFVPTPVKTEKSTSVKSKTPVIVIAILLAGLFIWLIFFNNPNPTNGEMIEQAIREKRFDIYEIIARDTNHRTKTDIITYRGENIFPYMTATTTGTIVFIYNTNTKNWERFKDGDNTLSTEESWARVYGDWYYSEQFKDKFIDFSVTINSIDGNILKGEYFFEGDYRLRKLNNVWDSGTFEMSPGGNMLGDVIGMEYRIVDFEDNFATATYEIFICRYNGVFLMASNTTALGRTFDKLICTG